jgi:hypothetical protein
MDCAAKDAPVICCADACTGRTPKIAPLVLKRRAAAFDSPDYLHELKYDGFRALLEIDGSGARLFEDSAKEKPRVGARQIP